MRDDELTIAGRSFGSRLITGTGKYASFAQMAEAKSRCETRMTLPGSLVRRNAKRRLAARVRRSRNATS